MNVHFVKNSNSITFFATLGKETFSKTPNVVRVDNVSWSGALESSPACHSHSVLYFRNFYLQYKSDLILKISAYVILEMTHILWVDVSVFLVMCSPLSKIKSCSFFDEILREFFCDLELKIFFIVYFFIYLPLIIIINILLYTHTTYALFL